MGNYSKNPQDVLADAQAKNYSRVRFQQGKPILDRELNLLGDLAGAERLARTYIGSGLPDGSNGFKIERLQTPNDFQITAGRCLVNGYEVVLAADSSYRTQPHKEHLIDPVPYYSFAFLRVFTREVTDTEDADLQNDGDVGFETALREQVAWEVLLLENDNDVQTAKQSPDYFLLAEIWFADGYYIDEVRDRRAGGLNVSAMEGRLKHAEVQIQQVVKPDGTLQEGIISRAQMQPQSVGHQQLALDVLMGGVTTVPPGQTHYEMVVHNQQLGSSKRFYVPLLAVGNVPPNGPDGQIEASIIYRQGVLNQASCFDVMLRLTNSGGAALTAFWQVMAFKL